jgi:hypothetical protein
MPGHEEPHLLPEGPPGLLREAVHRRVKEVGQVPLELELQQMYRARNLGSLLSRPREQRAVVEVEGGKVRPVTPQSELASLKGMPQHRKAAMRFFAWMR